MERYISSVSYQEEPYRINADREMTFGFVLEHTGETLFDVVGAVPNGDWAVKGNESAFVTIFVDGEYNQDLIFFYGEEIFQYQRLLGRLEAGKHEIKLVFSEDKSSSFIKGVNICKLEVRHVRDTDPDAVFYKNTPLIYGRNINHSYESTCTDTPLLVYYYCDEHDDLTMTLEYHIIFSHEDWGTIAPALMSKWGRTTDIEWVYRVKVDALGNIQTTEEGIEEFQAPEHVTTRFNGQRSLVSHPVLQAATLNGNVSDQITSGYRYMMRPAVRLPREVNREAVMNMFPWTYKVTAKEMIRQEPLEQPVDPQTPRLADQRSYMFLQIARKSIGGNHRVARIDIKVKLTGYDTWYTSIHEIPELAYESVDGPFSTTVKLPQGTAVSDIEEITAAYVPIEEAANDYRIEIPGIRAAFFLNEEYMPIRPIITSSTVVTLSADNPQATLWKAKHLFGGDKLV